MDAEARRISSPSVGATVSTQPAGVRSDVPSNRAVGGLTAQLLIAPPSSAESTPLEPSSGSSSFATPTTSSTQPFAALVGAVPSSTRSSDSPPARQATSPSPSTSVPPSNEGQSGGRNPSVSASAWSERADRGAAPGDAAPVDAAPVDAAPVDAAPVDAAPVDATREALTAALAVAPPPSGPSLIDTTSVHTRTASAPTWTEPTSASPPDRQSSEIARRSSEALSARQAAPTSRAAAEQRNTTTGVTAAQHSIIAPVAPVAPVARSVEQTSAPATAPNSAGAAPARSFPVQLQSTQLKPATDTGDLPRLAVPGRATGDGFSGDSSTGGAVSARREALHASVAPPAAVASSPSASASASASAAWSDSAAPSTSAPADSSTPGSTTVSASGNGISSAPTPASAISSASGAMISSASGSATLPRSGSAVSSASSASVGSLSTTPVVRRSLRAGPAAEATRRSPSTRPMIPRGPTWRQGSTSSTIQRASLGTVLGSASVGSADAGSASVGFASVGSRSAAAGTVAGMAAGLSAIGAATPMPVAVPGGPQWRGVLADQAQPIGEMFGQPSWPAMADGPTGRRGSLRFATSDPSWASPSVHSGARAVDTLRSGGTALNVVTPLVDAAASFRATLAAHPTIAPRALPQRWQPLASAIVGAGPVRISTGTGSRTALRAAGKVAATTGNVIHLDHEPVHQRDAALLAHELTHVASPSPLPRFFDDDRPSAEEHRAEQIADIIRRSPILPRGDSGAQLFDSVGQRDAIIPAVSPGASAPGGALGRSVGSASTSGQAVIRRRLASSSSGSGSGSSGSVSGMLDADDLASRLNGTRPVSRSSANGNQTIHRQVDNTIHRQADNTIGRATTADHAGSSPVLGEPSIQGWDVLARAVDSSGVHDFVDWIMEQVENRMAGELERRGGHYRGDF